LPVFHGRDAHATRDFARATIKKGTPFTGRACHCFM
jgi:hypothetical protein